MILFLTVIFWIIIEYPFLIEQTNYTYLQWSQEGGKGGAQPWPQSLEGLIHPKAKFFRIVITMNPYMFLTSWNSYSFHACISS